MYARGDMRQYFVCSGKANILTYQVNVYVNVHAHAYNCMCVFCVRICMYHVSGTYRAIGGGSRPLAADAR